MSTYNPKVKHDIQYLDLVEDVLTHGIRKTNRTGTATLSVFNREMVFDISNYQIPLLTTKRMHIPSILHELVWYLQGSGSGYYLKGHKIRIWDEWMTPDFHLNYVYGYQWRRWPHMRTNNAIDLVKISKVRSEHYPKLLSDPELKIDSSLPYITQAKLLYDKMVGAGDYHFICDRWLSSFTAFLMDIRYLPGFFQWEANGFSKNVVLSSEYFGTKFKTPATCALLPTQMEKDLIKSKGAMYVYVNENSKKHASKFYSLSHMEQEMGWGRLRRLYEQTKNRIHIIEPPDDYLYRPKLFTDQLQIVVDTLKNNPNDRRIIVNSWNVDLLEDMQLPPCHYTFQFWVDDTNRVSCKLTQRSADVGLGVPFNIAQYSILTVLIAKLAGKQPGKFIWSGGDVHIYENHIDGLNEQLNRLEHVHPSPTINISDDILSLDTITFEDFNIQNYKFHKTIKLPVAV